MTDKKAQRSLLRQRRAALSRKQIANASQAVSQQVRKLPCFKRAHHIGFYMAGMGEIDPADLLNEAAGLGKRCYLPVLHPFHPGRLWFTEWRTGDPVRRNCYGIIEPVPHHKRIIKPYALDLVLMPLLGFDDKGNRLGMGKGYYDRCFSHLRYRRLWRKPVLIGIAHAFQQIDRLKPEAWDVPLDGVVTERKSFGPFKTSSHL